MRIDVPLPCPYDWPSAPAKALFALQRRPPRESDEIVTAFRDGQVTLRRVRRVDGFTNALQEIGYQGIRAGDLVIHSMDGFAGAIGVADADGKASPVVHAYRPMSGADVRFFAYLVRSLALSGFVTSLAKGIRERSTAFDESTFRALRLPFPPLDRQREIADFLDAETARIDTLMEKKRKMTTLLQKRWRSAAVSAISRLMSEYRTVPLRRVTQCLDRRRIPLSSEERADRQGPFPYYGASAIVDWIDDYLFDEDLVLVGEDGAQLGEPDYPIAQRVSGKIWVNNHAHVLRPVGVDPDLLVFHLNTLDRMPFISGATREKFTQDDLGRIPLPAAPISTQVDVAAQLMAVRVKCDHMTQLLEKQITLLTERRQALITAAVTGELDLAKAAA